MNYECLLFILGNENYLINEHNIFFSIWCDAKVKEFVFLCNGIDIEMRIENTCVMECDELFGFSRRNQISNVTWISKYLIHNGMWFRRKNRRPKRILMFWCIFREREKKRRIFAQMQYKWKGRMDKSQMRLVRFLASGKYEMYPEMMSKENVDTLFNVERWIQDSIFEIKWNKRQNGCLFVWCCNEKLYRTSNNQHDQQLKTQFKQRTKHWGKLAHKSR